MRGPRLRIAGPVLGIIVVSAFLGRFDPACSQGDRLARHIADLSSDDAQVRRDAVRELGRVGIWEAVEPLVPMLADPEETVRSEARDALEQVGDDAVPDLLEGLMSETPAIRAGCADVLGRLDYLENEDFENVLLALVNDVDADVRLQVCAALGRVGGVASLEPLRAALEDPEPPVQVEAAASLAQLGDGSSFELLLRAVVSSDVVLRGRVIEPLMWIGTAASVQAIRDLTSDSDRDVRGAAYQALLSSADTAALQAGLEGLTDPAWQVRSRLAHVAGALQLAGTNDALLDRLTQDESPSVRVCAAMALANMGDLRAVPELMKLLGSEREMERAGGASALGLLRIADAAPALTALLEDEAAKVRRSARLALLQILEECPDCPR